MEHIIIGVDVGLNGGITVLDGDSPPLVLRIPVKKIVVNKKNKNVYDIEKLVDIFEVYKCRKVLFCIEMQGVRPGEGSVSAMTIGSGFGQLIGVAHAFHFKVSVVRPSAWKKHFPYIEDNIVGDIRKQIKEKQALGKMLKEKREKKCNNKDIEKLKIELKKRAKDNARELAASLFPDLQDIFSKKNSDGIAESLLIALYGRDNQSELV